MKSSKSPAGPLASNTNHPTRGRGRSLGRVTQANVAEQAGVTTMTVSRFLRAPELVASGTADRIRAALERTGYTPNKHAGMLAGRRSSIVAVIVPSIASSTFSSTVQALSDGLQSQELELLLAATNYDPDREEQQIRAVLAWSPSALVVTGRTRTPAATALLRQAQASGMPVVQIWDCDASASESEFVQIGFNHTQVGELMARHLLSRGHHDLVYVDNSVPHDLRAHERGKAFARVARKATARVRVVNMPRLEPMVAGRAVLQQLMADGLPSAMAFASDFPAAGAWLQAQEVGIAVPGQLAMLGFGDYPIAAQLGAGLSTVSVDRQSLGTICAQQVLAMVYPDTSMPVAAEQREIRPRIVERGST
jgi:LacI family gluconate utilization system Gnt-I transcriptional repressor